MGQTWRWYDSNDPVSLTDIRQADITGVVTALHHVPNDEVWSVGEILKRKAIVEDAGLVWSVVESVPTYEDIKTHTDNYGQWIANYQQTLCNLAQYDIRTVCYNFMPILNQARTDLEYVLPDGSKALRLGQIEFATFEMHILKRPGAEADCTEEEITQTAVCLAITSDEDKTRLTRNIVAGLLDAEEGYTLDQFHKHLGLHKDTDKAKLRKNFAVFLKAVIPTAEEIDVHMAVYPDDPPRPILGLPRIISTIEDIQWMVDTVDSMANGFTMCTGFYGMHADNDPADIVKQFGPRIYFTHLCSTIREDNPKTFHEATYLNGDVDMYRMVKAIIEGEHYRKTEGKKDLIPTHPGHGHQILGDLKKKTNPGYSTIDRLKGLAEVCGARLAIQHAFFSR